uniref:Phosducin n=1 Tax=Solanum tuberosum TaxID=4113 RepID=M1DUL5_SOLTU
MFLKYCVALALCQSDHVLNDGHSRHEQSRETVIDGVRSLGVALALCQSDHVLNDGHSRHEQSRETVIDGVRKSFFEIEHEDDDGS